MCWNYQQMGHYKSKFKIPNSKVQSCVAPADQESSESHDYDQENGLGHGCGRDSGRGCYNNQCGREDYTLEKVYACIHPEQNSGDNIIKKPLIL